MRKKLDLNDLIIRFAKQIQIREQRILTDENKIYLAQKWRHNINELHKIVKEMEQNVFHSVEKTINTTYKRIEYQTGVDVLGFPTYEVHLLKFEKKNQSVSGYSKDGGKTSNSLSASVQYKVVQR